MTTGLPFDDFRGLLARLPAADDKAAARTRMLFERAGAGSSRIGGLCAWLSGWSGRAPAVNRPSVALFAGTHGLALHGVSSRQVGATADAVQACGAGDSAINVLCSSHTLGLKVYDLALHLPTGDITTDAAMDERTCAATMAFGMEAIAGGTDIIAVGALRSAGDETVAAAMLTSLCGGVSGDWLPEGHPRAEAQQAAVAAALAVHGRNLNDPLEVLRRIGGREFAALAGVIIAARMERIAVVLDGLPALAAASVLFAANPDALAHCIVGGVDDAVAAKAAARLGLEPVLAQGMSAGEGTAAAITIAVLQDAVTVHAGLAAQEKAAQERATRLN